MRDLRPSAGGVVMAAPGWVVMDIGCLECGESTHLLGAYPTAAAALAAHPDAQLYDDVTRWGGQGKIVAYELPAQEVT